MSFYWWHSLFFTLNIHVCSGVKVFNILFSFLVNKSECKRNMFALEMKQFAGGYCCPWFLIVKACILPHCVVQSKQARMLSVVGVCSDPCSAFLHTQCKGPDLFVCQKYQHQKRVFEYVNRLFGTLHALKGSTLVDGLIRQIQIEKLALMITEINLFYDYFKVKFMLGHCPTEMSHIWE